MQNFRSTLFVAIYYLNTFFQMIFWLPVYFFLPQRDNKRIVKLWAWSALWLQHKIVGSTYDFRGLEHLPQDGGAIVAAKHQSNWETHTMMLFLSDPTYILKKELMYVPFFGWFAAKYGVIPVNRGRKSEALRAMYKDAAREYQQGRQIVIYPEGTRRMVGDEPRYKYGITHLYDNIDALVVPMALNSGLFWPRHGWKIANGEIVLEFLPPIQPGLGADDFSKTLESSIEKKVAELVEEGRRSIEAASNH